MASESLKTLFHPFEAGLLAMPTKGSRTIAFGATADFRLPEGFGGTVHPVQGFRPDFLALERMRMAVTPAPEGEGYDRALVLCGRHRGQNEEWLRQALLRSAPGGLVVLAGGKSDGADSFRKRVQALLPHADHVAKHHGVAFWFDRPDDAALAASGLVAAADESLVDGRFHSAPGMFSHDRIDPGSLLLAANLPEQIKGKVADFGAGWGYLSAEMLKRNQGIAALDLYEADFASLEAARRNFGGAGGSVPLGFHWRDLLQEPVARQYDLVVMNPPFHQGRAAEPSIGEGMIRAAAAALKPGGRLMLVANRGLPYEKTLAAGFGSSGETCRDASFKVLWARR